MIYGFNLGYMIEIYNKNTYSYIVGANFLFKIKKLNKQ